MIDYSPLTPEEKQTFASLRAMPEFKSMERLILREVSVYTDEAMTSKEDQETHDRKIAVKTLKSLLFRFKEVWEEVKRTEEAAVIKKAEKPKEKKVIRIFGNEASK